MKEAETGDTRKDEREKREEIEDGGTRDNGVGKHEDSVAAVFLCHYDECYATSVRFAFSLSLKMSQLVLPLFIGLATRSLNLGKKLQKEGNLKRVLHFQKVRRWPLETLQPLERVTRINDNYNTKFVLY